CQIRAADKSGGPRYAGSLSSFEFRISLFVSFSRHRLLVFAGFIRAVANRGAILLILLEHEGIAAMGAGFVDGFVPGSELAIRVAAAAVKGLTFAGAATD